MNAVEVFKRTNAVSRDPGLFQFLSIEGNGVGDSIDAASKTFKLKSLDVLSRNGLDFVIDVGVDLRTHSCTQGPNPEPRTHETQSSVLSPQSLDIGAQSGSHAAF